MNTGIHFPSQGRRLLGVLFLFSTVMAVIPAATAVAAPTCGGLPVTMSGTGGDDVLVGTSGDDVIAGLGGNDDIRGKGGNDTICGNGGKDLIVGGFGDDDLRGNSGGDTLVPGPGDDVVNGGDGNDKIKYTGAAGPVQVNLKTKKATGEGNDKIKFIEKVIGSTFGDTLIGTTGDDTLIGKAGDDTLIGLAGSDTLLGGGGDDLIEGRGGADTLRGGEGNDDLFGGTGSDSLTGGSGQDRCFDSEAVATCEVATWAPILLSGTGDDVVALAVPGDDVAVVDFDYGGGSNFIVWSLNDSLGNIDLLVNEIGAYTGRRPVNTGGFGDEPVRYLDVTASADWSITVESLVLAERVDDAFTGSGDEVIRVGTTGVADFTHDGSSNFIVLARSEDGNQDLLVNEIGVHVGAHVVPAWTDYLDIVADGEWTVDYR